MIPKIVYSPLYNIKFWGIEKLHPFDSCKYGRIWQYIKKRLGSYAKQITLSPKAPVSLDILRQVHSEEYLKSLKKPREVAQIAEIPIVALLPHCITDKKLLKPMRMATAGTILAAQTAIQHGCAINLGGGYHHASYNQGEGFCVYADIPAAVAVLRQQELIDKKGEIVIIDLDAHQGNGFARSFYKDSTVHLFDMYNTNIYPGDYYAEGRVNCNIPLKAGTGDEEYLEKLTTNLPRFLASLTNPQIIFYNAGSDVYCQDALGGLKISQQGILRRENFMFQQLGKLDVPWVMVLSGGYFKDSYKIVAESIINLIDAGGE